MKKALIIITCISIFSSFIYSADTDVRLNSLGFLPNNDKIATVHATSAPANWYLLTSPGNATVTSGTFSGAMSDAQTGETNNLYQANFSSFTTPGNYYLNVPNVGASSVFPIAADAYNAPFKTVFDAMYLWRCGTAVSMTFNGHTFSHSACHMNDAYDDKVGGTGSLIASTKGWHDAGDYNKYTVNAGITLGMMFMAWEQFNSKINLVTYGLPSTAPGYPEYLEEIKWETDWLLTMQRGDGSVYDKVSSVDFDAFELPNLDTSTRYFWGYNSVGTVETATFCAMMAMASRNFAPYDAAYAATCSSTAASAYNYLTSHLTNTTANITGCNTGSYTGSDADAGRLWAAVEMWETKGDAACLADAETRIKKYAPNYVSADFDWANDRNLGMYTYALSSRSGRDATLLANVRGNITYTASTIVATRNSHAYGRPLGTNYYWGCNGGVARQAMILQIANQLLPNTAYLNTALDALGYLFGRNMHDRSYVTQVGINPPLNPHHRPSGGDGYGPPWPGYLVGGSPGSRQDPVLTLTPSGLPAAQYWADQQGSYSSNEVAINWQGALIYAMAGFLGSATTPTFTPTPTATFTQTPYAGTPTSTFTVTPVPTPGLVNSDCAAGAFTIDGNLSEADWSTGTWTPVTRVTEGTQGAVSARFKVKWDAAALYVGVDVTDPVLCNSGANWYNDDAVEIYLDMNNNKSTTYNNADDFQYSVRYGENIIREENGNTGTASAYTYQTAGGYSAEFRLPWATIGKSGTPGLSIGFDVGIDHNETCGATRTGVLMWNGSGNNWQNTSAFGTCTLQACAVSTPTLTRTATPTFTRTNTPTFTYTQSSTGTFTPTNTPANSATNTPVNTSTFTPANTATWTPTFTPSVTGTNTRTSTPTFTWTYTATPTATRTFTMTVTATFTRTPYYSPTMTPSVTETVTGTPPTDTATPTVTRTNIFTATFTATLTFTPTASPTYTGTDMPTWTMTPTPTFTPAMTSTPAITLQPTKTASPANTATRTYTQTPQPTPTLTIPPASATPTWTETSVPMQDDVYPCPVNPLVSGMSAVYTLETAADSVDFKVYSRAYRLVRNIPLSGKAAGKNISPINSRNLKGLASGYYLYVIEAKGRAGIKRSAIKGFLVVE